MDENINLTILNEINKAAKMGMDSISFVSEKVGDATMKDSLSTQYSSYQQVSDRVMKEFEKYGEIPDENDLKDTVMSWTGVQMNTMVDKSNSHIAEMMIQGQTMGLVECHKLLNHNPHAEQPVKDILNDFVKLQEQQIDQMKSYL